MEGEKEGGDGSGGALFFVVFRQSKSTLYSLLVRAQAGKRRVDCLQPCPSRREEGVERSKAPTASQVAGVSWLLMKWPSEQLRPVKQTSLACPRHRYTCHCLHSQRTQDSGESEGHFGSLQSWSGKACVAVSRAEIIARLCWLFNCYSVSR